MPTDVAKRELKPQTARRLVSLIEAGATLTEAGYLVGARPTTLKRWLNEDANLRNDVELAREDAKRRLGRGKADIAFAAPIREAFLEYLSLGQTRKAAANLCGINDQLVIRLMHNDDEFKAEVEHAEAEAESLFLDRIRKDALDAPVGKGWIAALEWLKRRRGSIYGDATRLEVFQQFDDIKAAHAELEAEGIHIPLDQFIADFQQQVGTKRGRPPKQKALPAPVPADD